MTDDIRPKYHLKLIVCGTGAVGKTSITRRYVENKFEEGYLLTVGMEPSNRIIEVKDGKDNYIPVNLLIYDVAGFISI
jgi:GTPase SAR1 family protein